MDLSLWEINGIDIDVDFERLQPFISGGKLANERRESDIYTGDGAGSDSPSPSCASTERRS